MKHRSVGVAISKDDSNLPDEVLTPGEVLFIPEEHAEDLAEAANLDPADINLLGRGWFQLDEFQLAELAGTAAAEDSAKGGLSWATSWIPVTLAPNCAEGCFAQAGHR